MLGRICIQQEGNAPKKTQPTHSLGYLIGWQEGRAGLKATHSLGYLIQWQEGRAGRRDNPAKVIKGPPTTIAQMTKIVH